MAENPKCLFSSKGIDCFAECPQYQMAMDKAELNRELKGRRSLELSLQDKVVVDPENLLDQIKGTDYATFDGGRLADCLYYQREVLRISK